MARSAAKKKPARKSLSSGRPPLSQRRQAGLTAATTRTLIRSHHRLNKELHQAESAGNAEQAEILRSQIEDLGGIKSYQQASILGQSKERGGDSSIVLTEWLKPIQSSLKDCQPSLSMLEVGALSTTNACATSRLFDVTHIDLNSQAQGILQQDFMQRPLPSNESEKFNIISLSLVLNYVPDPHQRGEMLRRCRTFLGSRSHPTLLREHFPALFVVLPLPCLDNSRYLNEERFTAIMQSLGFKLRQSKQTAKLHYSLWYLAGEATHVSFAKTEVRPGARRNNFTIVLDDG